MPDLKKPGVAFWATMVVVMPLLYVASFGPACWLTSQAGDRYDPFRPPPRAMAVYTPLARLATSKTVPGRAIILWMRIGLRPGHVAEMPLGERNTLVVSK